MSYVSVGAGSVTADEDFNDHPLPKTLADAEKLAASIERAVFRQTQGRVRDLCVEISRDGVLLTGHCCTYYAKQMAQQAAMTVPGGGQLTNRIEVA